MNVQGDIASYFKEYLEAQSKAKEAKLHLDAAREVHARATSHLSACASIIKNLVDKSLEVTVELKNDVSQKDPLHDADNLLLPDPPDALPLAVDNLLLCDQQPAGLVYNRRRGGLSTPQKKMWLTFLPYLSKMLGAGHINYKDMSVAVNIPPNTMQKWLLAYGKHETRYPSYTNFSTMKKYIISLKKKEKEAKEGFGATTRSMGAI